jgi:hypothetical protein
MDTFITLPTLESLSDTRDSTHPEATIPPSPMIEQDDDQDIFGDFERAGTRNTWALCVIACE